jgi:hypothetical protein
MKPFTTLIQVWIVLVAALALVIVPGAAPAAKPLLKIGPITVANGTVGISGTLTARGARAGLTVNGHPLGLDASGAFQGVVSLDGASAIAIRITLLGARQQTQYVIPLTGVLVGVGGVIPGTVLDTLEQAGISLLAPVRSASGDLLTVSGGVLDRSQLMSLTLNGVNILGALQPDGTFSVQLPGTTTAVTLTATDASGNTQSQTTRPFLPPRAAGTVSAARAVGLRITKLRFVKKGSTRTHRMRMIVTVKDRRGLLVRGAKITVRSTRAGRLLRQPRASKSGRRGMATFVLRLRASAYGKRLVLVTVAKTPRAKAVRRSVVLVPRRSGVHR